MFKTFTTALVLIPPQDVWPAIQGIRARHDKQMRRWMPHITLLYPFRPREQFGLLERELGRVCGGIEPFAATLATFGCFPRPDDSVVWLAPEPVEKFKQLQQAVLQAAPDCNDTSKHLTGFTPHLSVGQAGPKAQAKALVRDLQAAWKPIVFTADRVSLIARGEPPDDVFEVVKEVRLGR